MKYPNPKIQSPSNKSTSLLKSILQFGPSCVPSGYASPRGISFVRNEQKNTFLESPQVWMLDQTRKQRRDRQKALISARREATLSKEELRKIRNRTSAADFRQRTKNELLYLRQRVGKLLAVFL